MKKCKFSGSGFTFQLLLRDLLVVAVHGLQESASHGLENTKVRGCSVLQASPSDGFGALGKGRQKCSKIHLRNCAVALDEKPPNPHQ